MHNNFDSPTITSFVETDVLPMAPETLHETLNFPISVESFSSSVRPSMLYISPSNTSTEFMYHEISTFAFSTIGQTNRTRFPRKMETFPPNFTFNTCLCGRQNSTSSVLLLAIKSWIGAMAFKRKHYYVKAQWVKLRTSSGTFPFQINGLVAVKLRKIEVEKL